MDKRAVALILALLLAATFVACTKRAKDENGDQSSSSAVADAQISQDENLSGSSKVEKEEGKEQTASPEPEGTAASPTEEETGGGVTLPDISIINPSLDFSLNPTIVPSLHSIPDLSLHFPTTEEPKLSLPPMTIPQS